MTKPIGYYASRTQDAAVLEQITTTYGDRLEALDRGQKLNLLDEIVTMLCETNAVNDVPDLLSDCIEHLSDDALLGMMSAIVEQLRHGK